MALAIVAKSPFVVANAQAQSLFDFVQGSVGHVPTTAELLDPNSLVRQATRFWYSYHPEIQSVPDPSANQSTLTDLIGVTPSFASVISDYDPNSKSYLSLVMDPNVNSDALNNAKVIQQGIYSDWVAGQNAARQRLIGQVRLSKPVVLSKTVQDPFVLPPPPPQPASAWPYVLGGGAIVLLAGFAVYKGWI